MAARIPQAFLDQLLSRVDLVEVIDARVPLRKLGREYGACCPFHAEKTPSFTVSPSKQFYHCFGCGAHGTAISFLMNYERLGFIEAVEQLARSVSLELPQGVTTEADIQAPLVALVEQAAEFFRQQLQQHPARQKAHDYLRQRGLDQAMLERFGIGYAPPGWDGLVQALGRRGAALAELVRAGLAAESDKGGCYDRFRDRLMFPIRDRRGRTIAFGGRALGDATPKYLNSPETPLFHKGRELYGLYEARKQGELRRLLVVEGYLDVVALVQHGLPYTVATLGTATTAEHLERLFRLSSEVVFCFDGDRAGRAAAWRALEQALPLLRDGRQVGFLFLPDGEDPDSLVRKEGGAAFSQRLEQARPLADYLFERLRDEVDLNRLEGRARLAERARPLLGKLPDSVYRDLLVERLATLTGTDPTRLSRRFSVVASAPPVPVSPPTDEPLRNKAQLLIALLLDCPELARQVGTVHHLRGAATAELELLVELIELIQGHPHIQHAAQLLTRYADSPTESALRRLAAWQPPFPPDRYLAEFQATLAHLEEQANPHQRLLDKLIRGELTADEKEQLRRLSMTSRHRR
jgi:DNA primase